MATESERCVDELLKKQVLVEQLLTEYETSAECDRLHESARRTVEDTQKFIANNRDIIPSYCLKKVTDALKKLETHVNKPKKSKFQFKSKSSSPSVSTAQKSVDVKASGGGGVASKPLSEAFGFRDITNETLKLGADQVDSKDVSLINLNQCSVSIYGCVNTMYIRDLTDTTVTVVLACRAITVANCKNCRFRLACQQLRIDSTTASKFEVFTSARSMLESSKDLEFSELHWNTLDGIGTDQIEDLLLRANFNRSQNNWRCIDDFDWLSPNSPSKNFKVVD